MSAFYYNQEFLEKCIGNGLTSSGDMFSAFKTKVQEGEDKIHDSIRMILSTRVGERFFVPEFGSKLHLALFEQNDMVSRDLIVYYVTDALEKWEKRISVDDVEVGDETDDNIVPITILYHIANSNVEGSYVYPFNVGDDGDIEIYSIGSNT
jgi:hypothetical protein